MISEFPLQGASFQIMLFEYCTVLTPKTAHSEAIMTPMEPCDQAVSVPRRKAGVMGSHLQQRLLVLFCISALLSAVGCATLTKQPLSNSQDGVAEDAIPANDASVPQGRIAATLAVTPPTRGAIEASGVFFETAERFRSLNDMQNAADSYRKAVQLNPANYTAQYQLAEALARQNDKKPEAIALLKDLLHKLHYQDGDADLQRLRSAAEGLLLGLDELGMALAQAANLIADYGMRAEEAKRYESALALYQKALELWPACTEAQRKALQLCRKQGWKLPSDLVEAVTRDLYLEISEMKPTQTEVKNGEILYNETRWSLPLFNKGKVFTRGLWMPAPARVTYDLNGRYKRFSAAAFVSAFNGTDPKQVLTLEKELSKPGTGTVRFRVVGDGNVLFESNTITYGDGPLAVSVDVTGVKTLVLETLDADDSDLLDFSVWGDARFYMK